MFCYPSWGYSIRWVGLKSNKKSTLLPLNSHVTYVLVGLICLAGCYCNMEDPVFVKTTDGFSSLEPCAVLFSTIKASQHGGSFLVNLRFFFFPYEVCHLIYCLSVYCLLLGALFMVRVGCLSHLSLYQGLAWSTILHLVEFVLWSWIYWCLVCMFRIVSFP